MDGLLIKYYTLYESLNFSECRPNRGDRDCVIVNIMPFFRNFMGLIGKTLRNFYIRPVDNLFTKHGISSIPVSIYDMTLDDVINYNYDNQAETLMYSIASKKKVKIVEKHNFNEYISEIVRHIETKPDGTYIIPFSYPGHITNITIEKKDGTITKNIYELQSAEPLMDYNRFVDIVGHKLKSVYFFYEDGVDIPFNRDRLIEKIVVIIFIGLGYRDICMMAKRFDKKKIIIDLINFTKHCLYNYIIHYQEELNKPEYLTFDNFIDNFILPEINNFGILDCLERMKMEYFNFYRNMIMVEETINRIIGWCKFYPKIPMYYDYMIRELLKMINYSDKKKQEIKNLLGTKKLQESLSKDSPLYLAMVKPNYIVASNESVPFTFKQLTEDTIPTSFRVVELIREMIPHLKYPPDSIEKMNIYLQMIDLAYNRRITLEGPTIGLNGEPLSKVTIGYPYRLQRVYIDYANKLRQKYPFIDDWLTSAEIVIRSGVSQENKVSEFIENIKVAINERQKRVREGRTNSDIITKLNNIVKQKFANGKASKKELNNFLEELRIHICGKPDKEPWETEFCSKSSKIKGDLEKHAVKNIIYIGNPSKKRRRKIRRPNLKGGFINIKGIGKRLVRFTNTGKQYVKLNGKRKYIKNSM